MTPPPRPTAVERYVETENARTEAARPRRWLIMVASLLATFGCAPKPPPAQVIVTNREAFRESIRTIAAVDIALPEELSAAPHRDRLNVLVLDVLNRTGFEVVRLDAEEWSKATDKVGGLFDPRTGEADPAKYDEAHALLVEAADTVANKPVDGIARPRLVVEVAGFANYNAMWSGAKQPPLTSGAAWSSFLGGVIVQGRIRALSVHLPIRARSGELVFQSLAGLELLDLYNASGEFQMRELEDLFSDPERLDSAADLLWETLTGETVVKPRRRPGIDDPMR